MAKLIKATIPLKHEAIAIEAICKNYARPLKITQQDGTEIDNPITPELFTNNVIKSFIKENIKAYRANKASETARLAALEQVDKDIDLDEPDPA